MLPDTRKENGPAEAVQALMLMMPSRSGSNAPGWWFGLQTAEGDGGTVPYFQSPTDARVASRIALRSGLPLFPLQLSCSPFWPGATRVTDLCPTNPVALLTPHVASWDKQTVQPGDKIVSSVIYEQDTNSYTMRIAGPTGNTITTNYKLHPRSVQCRLSVVCLVQAGVCAFEDIYLEVEGQAVSSPQWQAKQERPACSSEFSNPSALCPAKFLFLVLLTGMATIVDPKTIKFTWNPNSTGFQHPNPKWGHGNQ
eukprot:gene12664-2315_t